MIQQKVSVGNAIIGTILVLFAICTFLPFYYVVMASISDPENVRTGQLLLWPKGFDLSAYKIIINNNQFISALITTITRTILGISINLTLTMMMAYALSKRYLPGRRFFMIYIIITMMFNGGIIPTYLIVRSTGILDTIWALIVPMAISTFNVILLRSFFENLHEGLEESAKIDGANDIYIFVKIYIPLSMAAIVTIGLFIGVFHWNQFMDAVIYIHSPELRVLQIFLRDLVIQMEMATLLGDVGAMNQETTALSVRMSAVFLGSLPILIVYPFIQKYFVKGVTLGSMKG